MPRIIQLLIVFIIYFFSGWIGIHFAAMGDSSLTLIWLPSGIALSALIIYGKGIWPAIWLASFTANTPYLVNQLTEFPYLIASIYGILAATINTLIQGIFAHYLYQKHIGVPHLKTSKLILNFVFKVILPPSMLNMALLVIIYSIGGYIEFSAANFIDTTLTIWLSGTLADFHGYFIIVPLALCWHIKKQHNFEDNSRLLALTAMCLFCVMLISLFIINAAIYLILIIGVFVSLYLGFRSSTLFILLVSLVYTFATAQQIGPFSLTTSWSSFLSLLMFIFSLGLPLLIISAKKYELKQFQSQLEDEVIERTNALNSANTILENISLTDGLTGVANRRHLDKFLETEWARAIRNRTSISLIMIDIDFFKQFNDSYGHLAGDECLKLIAKSIQKLVHRPSDLVARYGGEEFVVVLPETENIKGISEDIKSVIDKLNIPHNDSVVHENVTISIGCCSLRPKINEQSSKLLDLADKQLYLAKNQGRNIIKTQLA
ncbi:MAG: diguanylate cyclase [Colwellia sp.]|nr:diguanylate cyclase [Colwellia sp.]